MRNRDEYESLLAAMGVCVAARKPFLLWGLPGSGKTAVVESAGADGWLVITIIVSHYEQSDFAGLPIVSAAGEVTLAPPQWAKTAASHDGPVLIFFDELTTAPPALQAVVLRVLTHGQVGALQLGDNVSFAAAANPADVAAAGWELEAPTANRFIHLDWELPLDVFVGSIVTGNWPKMTIPARPDTLAGGYAAALALVAGFVKARPSALTAMPKDASSRGGAFPTQRTWDYCGQLYAWAKATGAGQDTIRLLVYGTIGAATGHEFLTWVTLMDLPDPEAILRDPTNPTPFLGMRPDRVHATLQALLAAVVSKNSAKRWTAALTACATAASVKGIGIDAAVPVVRTLFTTRPSGAELPADGALAAFAPALALAGLLKPAER
ncbi:MAG: ATP-binding protein [Actinomycetes bacterium]